MTTIKDTDLLLVNRDGVDYQATVSALPVGNVDLSEYAKLTDTDQAIVAKSLNADTLNATESYVSSLVTAGGFAVFGSERGCQLYANQGIVVTNTSSANVLTAHTLGSSDETVDIQADGKANFAGEVTAAKFIGDGSGLTNLPVPIQGIVPPIITYENADWSPGGKLSVETKGFCPGANTTSSCQWMRDYVDIPGATSCMGWMQTSTAGAYQLKILWTDADTGQTGLAISNVIDVGGTPPSESGGGLPDFRDLPALS